MVKEANFWVNKKSTDCTTSRKSGCTENIGRSKTTQIPPPYSAIYIYMARGCTRTICMSVGCCTRILGSMAISKSLSYVTSSGRIALVTTSFHPNFARSVLICQVNSRGLSIEEKYYSKKKKNYSY